MGIVAHPGEITSIAVSFDGKFVFSAGGSDLTVNMWNLFEEYPDLTDQSNNSILPYLQLLEGGPYGELHQNLIDYFYYCQLRHGGEDTLDTRFLSGWFDLNRKEVTILIFIDCRKDTIRGNPSFNEIGGILSIRRRSAKYDQRGLDKNSLCVCVCGFFIDSYHKIDSLQIFHGHRRNSRFHRNGTSILFKFVFLY